jgi:hypothetical protein
MLDESFETLRATLLRGGVAPRYVVRTLLELEEHLGDLEAAELAAGTVPAEAARRAHEMLGDPRAIAAAVLAREELLDWPLRWPRVAYCLRSAATVGTLPALPILYCLEHRPGLARWSASIGMASALVGSVLAWLDWMIMLN